MRDHDLPESASTIFEMAAAEPDLALELAGRYLEQSAETDHRGRAVAFRAMSVATRILGRFDESIEMADRARQVAGEGGDPEEELLAVLTMVGPLVITGRSTEALDLIDGAAPLATTGYLQARISYQRGVVWMTIENLQRAIAAYETALPAFREAGDETMIRSTLQNLGNLRVATGDRLDQAERELDEALVIAATRHEEPTMSGIQHNLGLLAANRGDIVRALQLLTASDEIYQRLTGATAPQHSARCEVLMSAGLFREALRLAREIAAANRAAGDMEHLGDTLLVVARAGLYAGDATAALEAAEEALSVLTEQGRLSPAGEAHRIGLEARHRVEGPSRALFDSAVGVATELEVSGHFVPAVQARLLAGRVAIELGDSPNAVDALQKVAHIDTGPVELRVQARLARALLCQIDGDIRGAFAAARAGLGLIDEYQSALGATDLRMGLDQHGDGLGEIGLGLALRSDRPRTVFRWMEQTRARSLRHEPVSAPGDDAMRAALSELRHIESEMRDPDNRDHTLLRRRRLLQDRIRDLDRVKTAGPPRFRASNGTLSAHSMRENGEVAGRSRFDVDVLLGALDGRALIELGEHGGRLFGVLLRDGRARRFDAGPADRVRAELAHVRFALRRAARRGRRVDMEGLTRLDRLLFEHVALGDDELVVVPPPVLMATPWAALPSLRGRPLGVSPSAEMWWRAMSAGGGSGPIVLAAGPDLVNAGPEVAAIADLYPRSALPGIPATVEELRSLLDGARVAHVACHAHFEVENPMFSSLRLADGDLNVYDIEMLDTPPDIVVLSACDSGYSETRPGDELAGLTSALLTMGTRSVVAGVGLVPDSSATSEMMIALHRGLIDDMTPTRALAAAQMSMFDEPERLVAAASFVAVGA